MSEIDRKILNASIEDKPIYHPIPVEVLEEVARRFRHAKKKYGNVHTWRQRDKDSRDRYYDSLMRHLVAYRKGEIFDGDIKDEPLTHIGAVVWNAIALCLFELDDIKKLDELQLSIDKGQLSFLKSMPSEVLEQRGLAWILDKKE